MRTSFCDIDDGFIVRRLIVASNLVLSYLRKQNRPYSATDITNNLHNAVTKSTAQKILQQLVEAGGVSCKTQGQNSSSSAR